jgi:hypothetical protein
VRQHRYLVALALVVGMAAPAVGLTDMGSAGAVTVRPLIRSCTPGEEFIDSSKSQRFYGTGAVTWFYNKNAIAASETLSTSTSNTIEYEIQSSQSVDAGVIFASANASFSEGVTYSHDDTSSVTTTVSAPAGRYGILQIGNQMGIVTGTYEVISSTCQITQQTETTGIFPLNEPRGTGAGNNTSPTPPWPQSKVS